MIVKFSRLSSDLVLELMRGWDGGGSLFDGKRKIQEKREALFKNLLIPQILLLSLKRNKPVFTGFHFDTFCNFGALILCTSYISQQTWEFSRTVHVPE